jgi:hypothetical protein
MGLYFLGAFFFSLLGARGCVNWGYAYNGFFFIGCFFLIVFVVEWLLLYVPYWFMIPLLIVLVFIL